MPHFVTVNDTKKAPAEPIEDPRFYVYSTAVDGPITDEMSEDEMFDWLTEHGYTTWLDGVTKFDGEEPEMMYWNGRFWYVSEREAYYVSPREHWRNGH